MTGPETNDYIIKELTGSGVRTDELEGRGEGFVSNMRDAARGEALNMLARKGGVAAAFYQESYFSEADMIQEGDCIQRFFCGAPLYKENGKPWVEWIGGKNWSRDSRFRLATSRAELIDMNAHHIVGRSNLVRAYWDNALGDNGGGTWWIYRNVNAKNFAVRQIFATPYEVKEYNVDIDRYPYPTDQHNLLMEIIIARNFKVLQAPADSTSNSRNDLQYLNTRR